ncbi:MAG: photosynthetic complex assembly protein PuhC [Sandaracinaceae bacterium]
MARHHHEQKVPRGAVIGAAVLIALSIGIAGFARMAQLTDGADIAPATESVDLRFEDRPDGSVAVLSAASGDEVAVLAPASNGFVRGVLRGMFRTRKLESVDRDEPFRLSRTEDGQLILADPASGRRVELRSFGRTNHDAFARLLAAGRGEG